MTQALDVDICVIGAGSGGLSVAAGAVQMGASVALVEKGKMGGDCLNYGCVPSKALLAAGHAAEAVRRARRFGVTAAAAAIDPAAVYGHVRETIAAIAPVDSVERFEGMGVKVIQAQGRFSGHRTVTADGVQIAARRIVVATGSSAFVPPIPGLDGVPYLTNESLFDLSAVPEHLVVIGGGPVGIEMAQAHRHLGARVTVLEMASILPHDDPELVAPLRRRLIEDGIDVREGVTVTGVEKAGNGVAVVIAGDGAETRVDGTHVLVAAGRRPTVDGLDLDKAGIDFDAKGIKGQRPTAHHQLAGLRRRRRGRWLPIDPHGEPSRRYRHPQHLVSLAVTHRGPRRALGHLHGAGAGPGWPNGGRGAPGRGRHSHPALALRRQRPGAGRRRYGRTGQGRGHPRGTNRGSGDRRSPGR